MQNSFHDKVLYKFQHPHGPGDVYFIWQKGESRSLLATTGADGTVTLFDRQGQLVEKITLSRYRTDSKPNNKLSKHFLIPSLLYSVFALALLGPMMAPYWA